MVPEIAELPLGAGLLGICPMPGRSGDYAGDLTVISAWRPSLVLTMTGVHELYIKGAAGFGTDLAALGIVWAHLPIADFGIPDGNVQTAWPNVSLQARGILANGGKVLAHCMGGCGRSGTALLRLMVEMGEDAEAALNRLRAVRPCAVETPARFQWAAAGKNHKPG